MFRIRLTEVFPSEFLVWLSHLGMFSGSVMPSRQMTCSQMPDELLVATDGTRDKKCHQAQTFTFSPPGAKLKVLLFKPERCRPALVSGETVNSEQEGDWFCWADFSFALFTLHLAQQGFTFLSLLEWLVSETFVTTSLHGL